MVIAVTKKWGCHVVEAGNEGAVKVAANLRKMPHKLAVWAYNQRTSSTTPQHLPTKSA
jgi:hypothetical protein